MIRPRRYPMTTIAKHTPKPAVPNAGKKSEARAQAVLEQMFAYFSFEPLPSERDGRRTA